MSDTWIDIGVNLTDKRFKDDVENVLANAKSADVQRMICIGTDCHSSEQAAELAQEHDAVYFTAGIHPHDAKSADNNSINLLTELLQHDKAVAVGETGLDFNRDFSPRPQQKRVFEQQLELASTINKPLYLHERDAFKTQYEMLKSYRDDFSSAVVHCFTGTKEQLYSYLDLDLYIGITGWLCDERRGTELRAIIKDIPNDRLLIETDAPYLLPRDLKPKPKKGRNEPMFIPHIAQAAASLRGDALDEIKHQCMLNAQRLFNIHSS